MNYEVLKYCIFGVLVIWLIVVGRLFCGKVCPVGYVQDLIFKIPFFIKVKTFKFDKHIRLLKYLNVVINLLILPALAFLGYMAKESEEAGPPKIILIALAASILFAIIIQRPFCKYICFIGTLSSLFNKISFYKYKILEDKCIQCGTCSAKCKMNITPYKMKNALECIRCGYCKKVCPKDAIVSGFKSEI